MKLVVVIVLALLLFLLVRIRLLHIDLSFPWFLALVALGFASMSEGFIDWVAARLGIVDPPLAIILVSLFIIVGLCTFLAIAISRLRQRQIQLVRDLAHKELAAQEAELNPNG